MFLSAALLLAASQKSSNFSYHMLMTTEALSPHSKGVAIIREKRKAFDFFYLIKPGAPKPLSLKHLNWRRTNVLVIYPGLVQRDAKIKVLGVKKHGSTISAVVLGHNGITTKTYYPVIIATIPKQPESVRGEFIERRNTPLASRHFSHRGKR